MYNKYKENSRFSFPSIDEKRKETEMKHSILRIIAALLLITAVLLSLIACGGNEDPVTPPSDNGADTSLPNTPDNGQTPDSSDSSEGDSTGDGTGDNTGDGTQSGEDTPPSSGITEGEDTNEGGFGEFVPFD